MFDTYFRKKLARGVLKNSIVLKKLEARWKIPFWKLTTLLVDSTA